MRGLWSEECDKKSMKKSNYSEQAESLADEAVRTDLRCEQTPSAQPIFMGLRIVSVKVLNRYEKEIFQMDNSTLQFVAAGRM